MEWVKVPATFNEGEERRREEEEERGEEMGEGVLYVKVMTDEQMEILRRQIAVYATICEQLVEMHKAVSAQQDSLAGRNNANPEEHRDLTRFGKDAYVLESRAANSLL